MSSKFPPRSGKGRHLRAVLLTLTALSTPVMAHAQTEFDAEPVVLDEILVTSASSIATSVQDAPASITVIDQEKIQASGARDVRDVLRTVRG